MSGVVDLQRAAARFAVSGSSKGSAAPSGHRLITNQALHPALGLRISGLVEIGRELVWVRSAHSQVWYHQHVRAFKQPIRYVSTVFGTHISWLVLCGVGEKASCRAIGTSTVVDPEVLCLLDVYPQLDIYPQSALLPGPLITTRSKGRCRLSSEIAVRWRVPSTPTSTRT
jgi:hypothetical protein